MTKLNPRPAKAIASALFLVALLASPCMAEVALPSLVGSYVVKGGNPSGTEYGRTATLDISLGPSGLLELSWDSGSYVGIGQITGDVLAVASASGGEPVIMIMKINSDGSLEGKWWRRTDRGTRGYEVWRRK